MHLNNTISDTKPFQESMCQQLAPIMHENCPRSLMRSYNLTSCCTTHSAKGCTSCECVYGHAMTSDLSLQGLQAGLTSSGHGLWTPPIVKNNNVFLPYRFSRPRLKDERPFSQTLPSPRLSCVCCRCSNGGSQGLMAAMGGAHASGYFCPSDRMRCQASGRATGAEQFFCKTVAHPGEELRREELMKDAH